jgi:hypothetical protein
LIRAGADWSDLLDAYKRKGKDTVEAMLCDVFGVTWGAAVKITGVLILGA